jgi:hypothetical protein
VESNAAFVAGQARTISARQKMWLSCVAVEAFIEAGLVAEADVGQTHAAGWAVVVRPTASLWRNGRESGAALQAVFGDWIFDFRFSIFRWANESRGLWGLCAARA